jgi:DNA-binding response OmpR family regulator
MNPVKILYAEDETSLGKIVKETLDGRGFDVVLETDGAKILSAFKNKNPDLCILDIMLPNKDGFTIAEEIRKMDRRVPIIFLTAKTQTKDVVKGFETGANDYLRKPFSMEELIARIQNALRGKQELKDSSSNSTIHIGEYIFQQKRQLLVYKAAERKLSHRENELLKLLYENKDRIIDRKFILNLLWGDDSFFNSRNLDVYITRLRSYFKEDPSVEIITIKGIGYRMVAE